jgi:4-alpha-glucanotransferase
MKRSSGVLMHVSSLWGKYSEGSLGAEAREWIDFLAASGFGVWQVLPFTLPDECNSPYKSFSAFSVNPFFIDLPTLRENGLLTDAELLENVGVDPVGEHIRASLALLDYLKDKGSGEVAVMYGVAR